MADAAGCMWWLQSEFEYLKSEIQQLKASVGKNAAVDKVV